MTARGAAWLLVTVLAYLAARATQARGRGHALLNTVLVSAALIVALKAATGTTEREYAEGGRVLLWLLGPATAALAIPLYEVRETLRRSLRPVMIALLVGGPTAVVSAMGCATLLGANAETVRSLAPKSVTTPIAMAIAERTGGVPSLAAVFVILTGTVGALSGASVLGRVGVKSPRARGFALGLSSHGMGTARAFQEELETGVFATLAMTLNAVVTALVLPLILG